MSKTAQIVFAVIAFFVIWVVLIPMLPDVYRAQLIAQFIVVVAAIWFVMRVGGITPP